MKQQKISKIISAIVFLGFAYVYLLGTGEITKVEYIISIFVNGNFMNTFQNHPSSTLLTLMDVLIGAMAVINALVCLLTLGKDNVKKAKDHITRTLVYAFIPVIIQIAFSMVDILRLDFDFLTKFSTLEYVIMGGTIVIAIINSIILKSGQKSQ